MRRAILAVLLAGCAAPSAQAAWSPVVDIPNSAGQVSAVALNARGDAAVVWTRQSDSMALRVAVRHGGAGGFATTTLLRSAARAVDGATVTIDAHGETTVAWVERANDNGLLHGPIRLRTVFRSAGGRWSKIRTLANISPFTAASPRLAVAPDRRVLLTFNAGNRQAPGAAAAWRRPGHGFGRVQDLKTGPRGRGYLYDMQTQFDAAGRAYVSGTRDCGLGNTASTGVLLAAEPGTARLTRPRIVAPPPARDLHLGVTGRGRGVLVWSNASCSTGYEGHASGPVFAATVQGSVAGTPVVVDPALSGDDVGLAPGPGGTAEARWLAASPEGPQGLVRVARSDASGAFGAPFTPADDLVAVLADARGDQLVATATPTMAPSGVQLADLRARTPDGALTPPPLATGNAGTPSAVTPVGSGLAVAVTTRAGVRFESWTP